MPKSPTQDARFRDLFVAYREAVWAYCYRRLDPVEVPDAVAEVFLVVWRRMERVPEGDQALLWTYGVARNVVRSFTRSSSRRRRLHDKLMAVRHEDSLPTDVLVVNRSEDQAMLDAVARLKPADQEVLRLRIWEELSIAEISALTGISVRGVESRLARIRKKLESSWTTRTDTQTWWSPTRQEGGER